MSPLIYVTWKCTKWYFKPLEHPLSGYNLWEANTCVKRCSVWSVSLTDRHTHTLEKLEWFNSCCNLNWWSINLYKNCMVSCSGSDLCSRFRNLSAINVFLTDKLKNHSCDWFQFSISIRFILKYDLNNQIKTKCITFWLVSWNRTLRRLDSGTMTVALP